MVLSCLLQLSFNSWRATTHCGSQDRRIQKLKHILHSRGRGFYIRPHEGNPFLSSKKIPKQLHTSPHHRQRLPTHTHTQTDSQQSIHLPLLSGFWCEIGTSTSLFPDASMWPVSAGYSRSHRKTAPESEAALIFSPARGNYSVIYTRVHINGK